ncbi:DUF5908 family protein [uncultured Roseobacter sp.]|uniref:DUF5908 family protein n=1 Tax=uncultured Roseobacter sp. TaxID=114847 RepID=UPI0026066B00|nr:DUF5908 family protein [uncultured Roseobacter sp.]
MPVEIRELIVQARLTDEDGTVPGDETGSALSAETREEMKADILAECARMIAREHQRRQAR